jgi:hypothetical protein
MAMLHEPFNAQQKSLSDIIGIDKEQGGQITGRTNMVIAYYWM